MTWYFLIALNHAVFVFPSALDCNTYAFRNHIPIGQYACVSADKAKIMENGQ